MTRDERLAKLRAELAKIDGVEFAFILFEDLGCHGRIVQIALGGTGEPGEIEATNRYDDAVAGTTVVESAALAALGFDVTAEPFPGIKVNPLDTAAHAEIIDAAFLALGAPPDYTIIVNTGEAGPVRWGDDYPDRP